MYISNELFHFILRITHNLKYGLYVNNVNDEMTTSVVLGTLVI